LLKIEAENFGLILIIREACKYLSFLVLVMFIISSLGQYRSITQ